MFAGETSYDKSYENQSDTVCHDNVFVYGGRMIPQDWLYPFDFSAFIQSEVSPPAITKFTIKRGEMVNFVD